MLRISIFVTLWSDSMHGIISILWYVFNFTLWGSVQSILKKVLWASEKNVILLLFWVEHSIDTYWEDMFKSMDQDRYFFVSNSYYNGVWKVLQYNFVDIYVIFYVQKCLFDEVGCTSVWCMYVYNCYLFLNCFFHQYILIFFSSSSLAWRSTFWK